MTVSTASLVQSAKQAREERAEVAIEMKKLMDTAKDMKRGFTDEENEKWKGYQAKVDDLEAEAKRYEAIERAIGPDHSEEDNRAKFEEAKRSHDPNNIDPTKPLTQYELSRAFRGRMLRGINYRGCKEDLKLLERANFITESEAGFDDSSTDVEGGSCDTYLEMHRGFSESGEEFQAPRSKREIEEQAIARRNMTPIARATNVTNVANLGGETIPDEMMRPLEVNLLAFGGMRAVSTITSTSTGAKLPIPSANDVSVKGAIVAEDGLVPEQEIAFGERTLGAYKYSSKMIPFSIELLQDSATNLPNLVGRVVGERIGRITNEHFTSGTGTAQPEGILVNAGNSGVTAATAGEVDWKELVTLIHAVDPAYRQLGAQFMFHDETLAIIKKMEDSQGRPIWQPTIIPGEPDRVHGYTYQINQDMPTGAGAKGILFGALSKYMIREVRGITLMRLKERFAEYHREAFLAFARYDGKLIDAGTSPIKYMTLA